MFFNPRIDQLLEEIQQVQNVDCLELLNSQFYWELNEKDVMF